MTKGPLQQNWVFYSALALLFCLASIFVVLLIGQGDSIVCEVREDTLENFPEDGAVFEVIRPPNTRLSVRDSAGAEIAPDQEFETGSDIAGFYQPVPLGTYQLELRANRRVIAKHSVTVDDLAVAPVVIFECE